MVIENILIYKTDNELKHIVKVDGLLHISIMALPGEDKLKDYLEPEYVPMDLVKITIPELLHKLCLYDIREIEHIETEGDDIYHVPRKLLLIKSSTKNYVYDNESKRFDIGINLGTARLPDYDNVSYDLDCKYHIQAMGCNLFIGATNPNIRILKAGSLIM
jgi:hypothetical protein